MLDDLSIKHRIIKAFEKMPNTYFGEFTYGKNHMVGIGLGIYVNDNPEFNELLLKMLNGVIDSINVLHTAVITEFRSIWIDSNGQLCIFADYRELPGVRISMPGTCDEHHEICDRYTILLGPTVFANNCMSKTDFCFMKELRGFKRLEELAESGKDPTWGNCIRERAMALRSYIAFELSKRTYFLDYETRKKILCACDFIYGKDPKETADKWGLEFASFVCGSPLPIEAVIAASNCKTYLDQFLERFEKPLDIILMDAISKLGNDKRSVKVFLMFIAQINEVEKFVYENRKILSCFQMKT